MKIRITILFSKKDDSKEEKVQRKEEPRAFCFSFFYSSTSHKLPAIFSFLLSSFSPLDIRWGEEPQVLPERGQRGLKVLLKVHVDEGPGIPTTVDRPRHVRVKQVPPLLLRQPQRPKHRAQQGNWHPSLEQLKPAKTKTTKATTITNSTTGSDPTAE